MPRHDATLCRLIFRYAEPSSPPPAALRRDVAIFAAFHIIAAAVTAGRAYIAAIMRCFRHLSILSFPLFSSAAATLRHFYYSFII